MSLTDKANWQKTKARWTAFWERQPTDRPCLNIQAPNVRKDDRPWKTPASVEDIWFDADLIADNYLHYVETTHFAGEAVPAGPLLLGGWCVGCGSNVLLKDNTIYHQPCMTDIHDPVGWDPGPGNVWRAKMENVIRRLIQLAADRFFVGYPIMLPINDLLMLFRGNTDFLVDLAVDADECTAKLRQMVSQWLDVFDYFRRLIEPTQEGHIWSWPGLWSPKFVVESQSDMSCMISPEMFSRYVMPELDALGEHYERMWYHLDGPEAVRHLPQLLSRSYIKVIQYVPGSGHAENGPEYLELYRTIQAAGRGLDLYTSLTNAEFLIRHLRPEGLVLHLGASSSEEADQFVDNAVKWCGSHINQST